MTKPPKKLNKAKNHPKSGESGKKNKESQEMFRTRSGTGLSMTTIAVHNKEMHGDEPKRKRSKKAPNTSNPVKRRINSVNDTEQGINNNAQVSQENKVAKDIESQQDKTKKQVKNYMVMQAISDGNVVDDDLILGDGVDVELYPNAEQSDFDSEESEFEVEEDNCDIIKDKDIGHGSSTQTQGTTPKSKQKTDHVVQDDTNTGDDSAEFEALLESERVQKLFNRMLDKKLEDKLREKNITGGSKEASKLSGDKVKQTQGNTEIKRGKEKEKITSPLIKSPSDMALYMPAIKRAATVELRNLPNELPNSAALLQSRANGAQPGNNVGDDKLARERDLMRKVSNFIESIRMSDEEERSPQPSEDAQSGQVENIPGYKEACTKAQKAVLDAEKYKAGIVDPPEASRLLESNKQGEIDPVRNIFKVGSGFSDDDFFHLTCHLDSALISKIERGEFVELEKLLPKDKKRKSEEKRLEWVHHEGSTFLAPVTDRMNKISSFRCWEQAFRVYATVYCGAQPNRAKEISQYVAVINTAASSFLWENVYEYDNVFRHLMAFNPSRS